MMIKKMYLLALGVILLSAMLYAGSPADKNAGKAFNTSEAHDNGTLKLTVTNYNVIGVGEEDAFCFPAEGQNNYLSQGGLWIGAKKYRRNAEGQKLYWLSYPPTADNDSTVTASDPAWNPNLKAVVDTLTTIGCDGDLDLYEFLPAYNPLDTELAVGYDLYNRFNAQDGVFRTMYNMEYNLPFAYPDPFGWYCFTQPGIPNEKENSDIYETLKSYYYDTCPWGNVNVQRDWGGSRDYNNHVPLGLAVEQESYTWQVQNHDRMVVFKYIMHNINAADSLFDISLGAFMDFDCENPHNSSNSSGDLSGYCMGEELEFGYTRDGASETSDINAWVAAKLIVPGRNLVPTGWTWSIGAGPDDTYPLDFPTGSATSANEKYKLLTGKNPRTNADFIPIRGGTSGTQPDFEETTPRDTRFLISQYGPQPTNSNPNPDGRFNLAPLEGVVFYLVLFADYSREGLKTQAANAEQFIANEMNFADNAELTSLPYIHSARQVDVGKLSLHWISATRPDHFEVLYKPVDAPASQWQTLISPGNHYNSSDITNLTDSTAYTVKVASVFNFGGNEVYLESVPQEILIEDDPFVAARIGLANYPNPFHTETGIEVDLPKTGRTRVQIFNAKGQCLKMLANGNLDRGLHSFLWDGKNDQGSQVAGGIYFVKVQNGGVTKARKLLLMK